ncbi:Premnaspirodiene oxygenase [Sesamum angolense]|uniref:Premnaspirodiene oxygenase n=1 Tax=Sesamum angolense TaxID=2727404 RepID=A0AAE1W960_9LAMI|nr:Premnaspirodiene oxygenase [Sesamum angolense]
MKDGKFSEKKSVVESPMANRAWKRSKSPRKHEKLPPGPPKLPVIGHLHHLAGELSHRACRRIAQKYGPVIHLQLGEVSAVVISSREATKEVLKDQDLPAQIDLKASALRSCGTITLTSPSSLQRILEANAIRNGESQFPISNDNIKAIIFDMFSAATETSSTTIDLLAMAELMRNPRVMAKVQAEVREAIKGKTTVEESDLQALKYLKLVIKETFRLHPPCNPRACRDECKVNGYTIPLKSRVLINAWPWEGDPELATENLPTPERFDNSCIDFLGNDLEYIPFGQEGRIFALV